MVTLLAVLVVVGVALPAVAGSSDPGGTFFDDDGNIHQGSIEAIAAEQVTRGCNPPQNTNYCPGDSVTRGEMAAFLVRALGLTERGSSEFTDDDGSVFETDIEKLAAADITRGCNPPQNDRYCPDEPVTRGQMAAFLVRAFGYSAGGGANLFRDDDGSVFENDIDRLGTAGVTNGCNPPANDMFCPSDPVRRDEMASFLTRAMGLSSTVPPERIDTTNGQRINLLDIAASQGCGATLLDTDGQTDVCHASTSIAAGQMFYIEHGWFLDDWSLATPEDQRAFASDATRFDLSLNAQDLKMFESFTLENDRANDIFRFQFPGSLTPTTHTLTGEWTTDNIVELRIILDVTVVG